MIERSWPLDYWRGRVALSDALYIDKLALARLAPKFSGLESDKLAFLDVETTGLSGGTGTYAFLVGIGTIEQDRFVLRQFFLADISAEASMLGAVSESLSQCTGMVSFNGRTFDIPLLETRHILNRLRPSAFALPHIDLLTPARRLYRSRLPSCRLVSLEQNLLGIDRVGDIPGWLIPQMYFEYTRWGDLESLRPVFEHNAADILSLVALLGHFARVAGHPGSADPHDRLALARWDELNGRPDEALCLYEALAAERVKGVLPHALEGVVRLYRRMQRWEDCHRALVQLSREGNPVQQLRAVVSLAILQEHRFHNYERAEVLAREAIALNEVLAMRRLTLQVPALRTDALHQRLRRVLTKRRRLP